MFLIGGMLDLPGHVVHVSVRFLVNVLKSHQAQGATQINFLGN